MAALVDFDSLPASLKFVSVDTFMAATGCSRPKVYDLLRCAVRSVLIGRSRRIPLSELERIAKSGIRLPQATPKKGCIVVKPRRMPTGEKKKAR